MPELVNLKIKKNEIENRATVLAEPQDQFPSGLKIYLDEEVIARLDLGGVPNVGSRAAIRGIVEVESASVQKTEDGDIRSICLQITDLAIGGKMEKTQELENEDGNNLTQEKQGSKPVADPGVLYDAD